jgi:hypothetical protein
MMEQTELWMRCVRLEAALERETANADAFARAVLELWERLARAAESDPSDEAFRSEVLSIVESFRELLTPMLGTTAQDTVYYPRYEHAYRSEV